MLSSTKVMVFALFVFSVFSAHGAAVSNLTRSQTGTLREPKASSSKPVLILGHAAGVVGLKAAVVPAPVNMSVQSYKEWKAQKIHEVQNRVDWLQQRLDLKKIELAQKKVPHKTEAQLSQELGIEVTENQLKSDVYVLEMARDLTVSDYFAAYLTKQGHKKEAFKEVAGKMSPDEVAELMNAYANSMFSGTNENSELVGNENTEKVK
jgi:hypothetical protein